MNRPPDKELKILEILADKHGMFAPYGVNPFIPMINLLVIMDNRINELEKKEKCGSCEKKEKSEPHSCPFSEALDNDSETLCNCCDDCTDECSMRI